MAALDKLVKALEGLKIIKESSTFSDESLKRKEKATLCVTVADLMCSPAARNAPKLPYYLSYSMETLLHMCDDPDSDIRMTADESLNRIIRAMMESNIVKVQVELHKEIKKNGSARSLRAALWRFAELSHMIRPQKGKPYVQNLVPCIIQIAKRTEEPVLETLAAAMPKIFSALGSFTTDNDIKSLLRTFLSNIASEQTVVRRTAAASIMAICLNCRKSQVFLCYTLNTILDSVLPVRDDQLLSDVLGVLNLTRQLLLHLDTSFSSEDNGCNNNNNNTSFLGSARANLGSSIYPSVDRFLQVYELCLHWSDHQDHNVVTASLETLQQLLICVSSSPVLTSTFVSNAGLSLSRILPSDNMSKYSMRTLSEMSVATPSLVLGDESSLLDATEDCMVKSRLEQWMQDSVPRDSPTPTLESGIDDMDQQQSDYISTLDSDCMSSTPAMSIDYSMQRAPSLESEQLLGRDESPTPPPSEISSEIKQVWDIGSAIDTGPALVYCARHLVTKFLLPDQGGPRVRVSVRALALSCLGQVLNLMPRIFLMNIDRRHQTTSSGFSHVSDVLTFVNHNDQQLRGLTMTLIGQLIKSALSEGRASFSDWSNSNMSACDTTVSSFKTTSSAASSSSIVHPSSDKLIQLATLVSFLVQGLEDESAICVRHTMTGVEICLSVLLSSKDSKEAVPLLHAFTNLTVNPYWLIKVKMIELLSRLNYLNVYYIIGNNSFQDKVFESVMISQLGDQDNRVRKATAEAIARIVENLFYPIDHSQEDLVTSYGLFIRQKLLSGIFDQDNPVEFTRPNMKIESALSRIVSLLSYLLLQSTSKYLTAGCCETLGLLSIRFPCKLYRRAWQCQLGRIVPATKSSTSPAAGLLATVLAFLTSAPVSLDLDSHHWLLLLSGNLYTGLAESCLLNVDLKTEYDKTQLWSATGDKKFGVLSEQLLSHVMRVLSVFVLVLEDQPSVSQRGGLAPSPVKRRPSRAASPAKSSAVSSEKEVLNITAGVASSKEEKGKSFGYFSHLPHYCRMHDNLASAYKNYKVTLEGAASEKFVNLLRMVLTVLGQILEYCGLAESGRIAEEILHYLRATVVLDPTTSVSTVQQLLKSLFGANYLAHWEDEREKGEKRPSTLSVIQDTYTGFYGNVFQQPYQKLSDYLEANSKISNDIPRGGPSYVRERATAPKSVGRNSDKAALASYIRLFEPMVIQALKKYTVTSDVSLQMAVLELLTQLVRLRVNYCLLDSDQIFISFIFKQFEFLEEGQITRASELIPKLFQFLVHLSHEKNHSKPVISFPRVIQLCAGLMASGQNPLTHCIPALLPVVEHVFLANVTNLADAKELETQREFLISMLLRLAEYPQVLHLLGVILKEGWRWEERWRKWSRLTADTVLPMLAQDKVLLDSPDSLACLLHLINSLAPGTLRPVDQILKVLFNTQLPQDGCSTERWLRVVLTMIIALICQGKEDSVLSRLEELQLCVHQQGDDPLNVTAAKLNHPPQLIFANLLLHVVELVLIQIESLTRRSQVVTQFEQLFAHFLLCCLVMFQSGSYLQVATALMDLVHEREGLTRLEAINSKFEALSSCCPLLTLLWSYLLTLINYGRTSYWSILMQTKDRDKIGGRRNVDIEIQPEECLNLEFVRRGVTILFCDYATENISDSECLTWLMIGHIEELVRLSTEPPVQELLAAVHRNPAASGLMVQAVSTRCSHITQVRFLCRLLTCLESVHPRDSGAVLKLLAPILTKHPHLVISRRCTALASRRTELLLTLEKSEVLQQITKDDLQKLLESLTSSSKLAVKHSGLVSLLNKLGAQCYDLSPVELDHGRQVNTSSIRTIMLDRDWFLTQVKLRSCGKGKNGPQCAMLLSQLSEEDIVSVLRSQNFDNSILQHCFNLGTRLTLQGYREVKNQNEIQLSLLFTAARLALLHHVHHLHSLLPRVHQVYHPVGRPYTTKELKYKERIDELLCDPEFIKVFFHLVPAVGNFMQSMSELEKCIDLGNSALIPQESWDAISKFSILCMESIVWMIENNKSWCGGKWPNCMHKALECTVSILKVDRLMSLLSISHLGSVVSCLVSLIHRHTDHTIKTPVLQGDGESATKLHTCYQMAALISLIEKSPPESWNLPALLSTNIGKLIICVGRSALVNWHCRTPLEGWGPPDPGNLATPPPILSSHLLQDIDILSLVVFRMSWLGWTTRQQFEESWMTLLSVVRANSPTDSQIELEQAANIIQGNSLTVKALTSLLLQTTLLPNPGNPCTGQLLHCPRDEPIDLSNQNWGPKLLAANESLCWKLKDLDKTSPSNVKLLRINERPNIERRIGSLKRYGYSQVSVSYMKTAVMSIEERSTSSENLCHMCIDQEQRLAALNLDVRSCIQFLLDLYSQWTLPGGGLSLSVLLEIVRSTVCLSDLFSERSHFSWMLDICLELSRTHPQEDEIMHQYLVVAVCKAASVLPTLETEVTERIIKLLDYTLKCNFLPARLAAVHGLLYLLQSQLMIKVDGESLEQKQPVVDTRQKLLQLSIDFVSKNLSTDISTDSSEESLLTLYALAFYLLEHSPQDVPQDIFPTLLQLTQSSASNKVTNIYNALIQGIDRLVLVCNSPDIRTQSTRLATEILVHTNPAISMPALQLLLSCIYSGEYDIGKERQEESSSEALVAAIEKASTLFNRIKWAYPVEAECVCSILPHLLGDFFPASEVLSKVVGEFLAPKQPHPHLISPVVFQVFSQACREQQLPLLQAWVVMSLPNFTQGIPVPIATWCLSCFFISASTNPWLRSLFPHVQSRIGKCTYEDRKLLCIAASDFYNQLSDDSLKKTFLQTFTEAACTPKSPFSDIIACISHT